MSLSEQQFCILCEFCVENLILPEDALREFVGLSPREPFLIPKTVCTKKSEIDRFLAILGVLYGKSRRKFESVAPILRGNVRNYFGLTPEAVLSTGNSNYPKQIPGTPWWVSSNSWGPRKGRIVQKLMTGMGFSSDYSDMIASICYSDSGHAFLPRPYHLKYAQFKASLAQ